MINKIKKNKNTLTKTSFNVVQLSKNAQSTSTREVTEKALLMNQGGFNTAYTEKDTRNKITLSISSSSLESSRNQLPICFNNQPFMQLMRKPRLHQIVTRV